MIGKKNSTLKKQSVKENKLLTTGVKALKFWHEASAGEQSIPFGSLTMPSDVAVNGFSNPSSTEILASNLALFQNNVTVTSSLNGVLMHGLTYVVKNSQIRFVGGYTALAGEIFEVVYKNDVITGTNVVDARPLTATGVLAAGSVLFATGEAFKTNQYPETQLGEVLVYVDGMLQFRNVGNATAIGSADGNYQEIAAVGGYGSMIKFNETSIVDRNIQVISRNLIAERPDISMMQFIETTQGQLDALVPTVAALAGVPESTFQSAPNQVDLKAFGDVVTNNTARVDILEDKYDVAANLSDYTKTKWQKKILSGSAFNGISSLLSFNNLTVGKTYKLSIQSHIYTDSNGTVSVLYTNGGSSICLNEYDPSDGTGARRTFGSSGIFTATATTIIATVSVSGGGGKLEGGDTFAILEELPNHTITSQWT